MGHIFWAGFVTSSKAWLYGIHVQFLGVYPERIHKARGPGVKNMAPPAACALSFERMPSSQTSKMNVLPTYLPTFYEIEMKHRHVGKSMVYRYTVAIPWVPG